MTSNVTLVLVHGAWHGSWCWEELTPLLVDKGFNCQAIDLPLSSLADDIAATEELLERISSDIVLVGHSYGGSVITAAGRHPRVVALVYVAAMALQPWETSVTHEFSSVSEEMLQRHLNTAIIEGDTVSINPASAVETFYHDCDSQVAARATARLRPMHIACMDGVVGAAAWANRRTLYVVTADDRAVPPETQQRMADRIDAEVTTLHTGHSPFYADPSQLADAISQFLS
jgi:pimeloyl-ACP methyl ester carboxylesterase